MVSKKKKFGAFIFAVIFSIAVVGGVFGLCYYQGIVSYPWQVKNVSSADNTLAFSKEEVSEPEEVVVEEKPEVKPEVKSEVKSNRRSLSKLYCLDFVAYTLSPQI